ncbi:MAG: SDR family oxidoreductase [Fimbriimonadaceae bacterium]|nr:SDR family oxidoreductase [Fimbriimonadaceae bacterium]
MNVVVFGASGRVGRKLIEEALAAGHHVRAVDRGAGALADHPEHGRFESWWADVLDPAMVREAMVGQDAVLGALGVRDISRPFTFLSDAMRVIVGAMERQGIRRIVAVGNSGALDGPDGRPVVEQRDFPADYVHVATDHLRALRVLEASDRDWTYVCPPMMPSGEATGRYVLEPDRLPAGEDRITVGDVARALVSCLNDGRFVGSKVGINTPS